MRTNKKKNEIKEIKTKDLDPKKFIKTKVKEIKKTVGNEIAIAAFSGGVDSSTTVILAHKALGKKLRVFFIDNGLMREGEPEEVRENFSRLGIKVEIIRAQKEFLNALEGIENPEKKREIISQTFYQNMLTRLVKKVGAKFILQGTIFTDIEETLSKIKRQHNVLEQIGIDTEKEYGYKIIEPLMQLRKDGVRKIAKALGLPKSIYNRMPFLGPALAGRIIGRVTTQKLEIIRKATKIVEEELKKIKAFQYMAILHKDKVTGIKEGKRKLGFQVEIRCWNSVDATVSTPVELSWKILKKLSQKITTEIPEVVSVTYNITSKPPSTIEAI